MKNSKGIPLPFSFIFAAKFQIPFMRYFFVFLFFLLLFNSSIYAQNRALWATVWDINSAEKIDAILKTAHQYHFNQLFLQVRYRGDALYFPNKKDSSFSNSESRCYVLKNSTFDPLQYAINQAPKYDIEIHAWIPVFVVTPHDLTKIDSNHVYYHHPEWITYTKSGKPMPYNSHEGAFLDPGIPQVQDYLLGVIGDLTKNYKVHGIQLDYIRYPDSLYGYNPLALEQFRQSGSKNFEQWKRDQVSQFVKKVNNQSKQIDSNIQVSAAVFANQSKAFNRLGQQWIHWQQQGYLDHAYVMAYNTSNTTFHRDVKSFYAADRKKTTIILRAWKDQKTYPVAQINEKIKIAKRLGYRNFGFYSYSGLVNNKYLPLIRF